MRFGYGTIGWQGPLDVTLRAIADLGFAGAEMFDLRERIAHGDNVGQQLKDAGLALSSAFFGGSLVQEELFSTELSNFQQTVRCIKDLGGKCVVVGGGRIRRGNERSDFRNLTKNLNELGRTARSAGVEMAYHPHLGTLVSTPRQIADAMDATDSEVVKLALDTAHLAEGNADPLSMLQQYVDRVVHVHLKDLLQGNFAELGEGSLPLVSFCHVLEENGYEGWCIVELDSSEDPVASARINARFIRDQLGATLRRSPR